MQGAMFVLFEPRHGMEQPEGPKPGTAGAPAWHDLVTIDWTTSLPFYEKMELEMNLMEKYPAITPFFGLIRTLRRPVDFYLTVFRNPVKLGEMKTGRKVLTVAFELDG